MKRAGLLMVALFSLAGIAGAEAYPKATVRKVGPNQNSYTLHDWSARAATHARASSAREKNYSEIDVTPAPTLQAAPAPGIQMPYPAPAPLAEQTYTQTHNPGPSQLPANRSGTASQSIYSLGPNWGPYYNGGYYNSGYYNGGYYNNGYYNGFYTGRGYNGFIPNAGFNYGPGFQSNLPQQRFDPLPGQHPYSIQRPQMFPNQFYQGGGRYRCR